MFYSPLNTTRYVALAGQPPLVTSPVVSFGQISTLLTSGGVLFPTNVIQVDPTGHIPTTMNFSFSVQQNVGFHTVVDVAYVGNLGRHRTWNRPINAVPFGANFNPGNADPTISGTPLPAAFLRPRVGYNNISVLEWASSSNYHSLQVTANRRFTKGTSVWSCLDLVEIDGLQLLRFRYDQRLGSGTHLELRTVHV